MAFTLRKKGLHIRAFLADLRHRSRFVSANILLLVLLSSLSLAAIELAFDTYNAFLYKQVAETLTTSTNDIEDELRSVEKTSYNIVTDPVFQESLAELDTDISTARRRKLQAEINDRLWTLVFERYIVSVNIVDRQGYQYAGGDRIPESRLGAIIDLAAEREGAMALIPPAGEEPHLICARQFREIAGFTLRPLGTLIIRVNIANIADHARLDPAVTHSNLIILSPERDRIYSSTDLDQIIVPMLPFKREANHFIKKIRNQTFFTAQSVSPYTRWNYVSIIPYRSIFNRVTVIKQTILAIYLVLFIVMSLMHINLIRALTQSVKKLDPGRWRETVAKEPVAASLQVKQDLIYLGHNKTIQKALAYIRDNLNNENLTLKWLAEEVLFVNVGYLSRLFARETGVKFSQYLMRLRMDRARELIVMSGDDMVREVACKIGFGNNPQYFSQVFRKYTGLSPSEYKKRYRLKPIN